MDPQQQKRVEEIFASENQLLAEVLISQKRLLDFWEKSMKTIPLPVKAQLVFLEETDPEVLTILHQELFAREMWNVYPEFPGYINRLDGILAEQEMVPKRIGLLLSELSQYLKAPVEEPVSTSENYLQKIEENLALLWTDHFRYLENFEKIRSEFSLISSKLAQGLS